MQFDQKVGQYHLKGIDIVITKRDYQFKHCRIQTLTKFDQTPAQSQRKTFSKCFDENDT